MRGSLSVIAAPAIAGLAFLCTALFGNQEGFQTSQPHSNTPLLQSLPHGSTIIVTNINDGGPGSLRQALADAQDGDTIQFDSSLNGQTITLTSGELIIDKNITITGPGPGLLTVSRNQQAPNFRIFHLMPDHTVAINGLTISGGKMNDNGGGIFNDHATVTLSNCVITGNAIANSVTGPVGGGGIYSSGTLTLVNSTASANTLDVPSSMGGGGIFNAGTATITQSSITGNSAGNVAGGIANSGMLTMNNSTLSNNRTQGFGHGLGNGGGIGNGGTLIIQNSTVNLNSAQGEGGQGGGITTGGTLEVINSTIRDNTAVWGAGIYGTATLTNSTISGNSAFFDGGGIRGFATASNSTISGNFANHSGGGISGGGAITNCTINNNTANSTQGSCIFATNVVNLTNTILVTGSSGGSIFSQGGSVTSHGYNLTNDNGGGFLTGPGDQTNTDPIFGPLQNNGGPTLTHDLLPGSPAIDAGDPNFTPPPLYDQRDFGYLRVYNGRIDIGAVEVQPAATISPTPTATATASATSTATATASPTPTATATSTATATAIATVTATPTLTPSPTSSPCNLSEGFENIATLLPNGWVRQNNSQPLGTTEWFQGDATLYGHFWAQSGSPASYIAANFLNGSGLSTISNWLLTPPVILQNGAKFSFWTSTEHSPLFPDRLQVRMSTNGTSQDVGTTATSVGDFATLLLDINPTYTTTGYPIGWTNYIVTLSGIPSPVTGRLAFRYFVENGGPSGANSNYIGLDTVAYYCNGTIPTPTPATPTPTPSVTPTPGTLVSSIAGTILNCSNPVPNIRVNVIGTVSRSTLSNGSGNYQFSFLPWAGNFTVAPTKAALAPGGNGISTTDVLAIQRHFLNIFLIPPGCRLTAADVNGDSMINTVDVVAVQRFFLGLSTGIANVGHYQFTPASRSYTGNGTNWTAQNYDTVVLGDIAAPYVQ